MPLFAYKGFRPDGSRASGTIQAEGLTDAIASVKQMGVYPKEVKESIHKERRFLRKNEAALLPGVTRQLSTLLSAGVPLMEALKTLSDENTGYWKRLLSGVREKVAGGLSLARALEGERVFPEFYVNMVAAGEEGGALGRVLLRLADFLEEEATIKSRVRMAMTYPAFMVSVGFLVMAFLFTFVIPKIVRIFENTKSALPFITVVLIKVSNFFVSYWWLVVALAVLGVIGANRLNAKNRQFVDGLKLKFPGGLARSLYYGRFARTLGFLLEGGLPMLKALELSSGSIGNSVLRGKVIEAARKVAEGARLSQSLEGFPPVLLQLIATGEKSGRLVEVMDKAADSYEDDFSRRVQRALSLIEPGMILVMGVVVGFIVLAVLLPMFQLNQLIK